MHAGPNPRDDELLLGNGREPRPAFWFLAYLPLLFLLHTFAAVIEPSDPDLGYHLTIGEQILESWIVPIRDNFRARSEEPEVAYSWLPDITLALALKHTDVFGLRLWVMFSALCMSIALIFLIAGRDPLWRSSLMLLLVSLGTFQICGPRPRFWASICFVMMLLLFRGLSSGVKSKHFLALIGLLVFWANVHISVVLAPLFLMLFLLPSIVQATGSADFRNGVLLLLISIFTIGCNPYGFTLFRVGYEFSPMAQQSVANSIVELRGIFALQEPYPVWIYPLIILFSWAVFTMVRPRCNVNMDQDFRSRMGMALVALFCAALTIVSTRYASFALIAAVATLCNAGANRAVSRSASLVGLFVYIIVSTIGVKASSGAEKWYAINYSGRPYPVKALEFVTPFIKGAARYGRPLTIFAPFGDGHFITWWLHEHELDQQARVFVDGRTDKLGRERFLIVQSIINNPCIDELLSIDADVVLVDELTTLFELLSESTHFTALGGDGIIAFVRNDYSDSAI